MTYQYTIADLVFVNKLLKAKTFTQKQVNAMYHQRRFDEGTATKRGDYSNFISKVAKKSKHRNKLYTTVYSREKTLGVIYKIMDYLKCDKEHAQKVYRNNIVPLCPKGFHSESGSGLVSIRYYSLASNSRLYILFTSDSYETDMNLDKNLPHDDIWTVKTSMEWCEIVDGSVGLDDIMLELEMATKEYEPKLLNVCITKA